MSGQTVPADFSGHMLDLDEDEDLEVFSKVKTKLSESEATASDSLLLHWLSCYVDLTLALTDPL